MEGRPWTAGFGIAFALCQCQCCRKLDGGQKNGEVPHRVLILGGILLVAAGCASSPPRAQAPRMQPPPPVPTAPAEVQTAQPGPGYVWIPGHYEWRAADRTYVWAPGSWIVPPVGQTRVPGHWETRSNGNVWVSSRWQGAASPPLTQPPPPVPTAPAEVRTAQPGPGYVWFPGHYEWRGPTGHMSGHPAAGSCRRPATLGYPAAGKRARKEPSGSTAAGSAAKATAKLTGHSAEPALRGVVSARLGASFRSVSLDRPLLGTFPTQIDTLNLLAVDITSRVDTGPAGNLMLIPETPASFGRTPRPARRSARANTARRSPAPTA